VIIDHYPYKKCLRLETVNLSNLFSRDNLTFQSQERRCQVTTLNLGPSFSVEKLKCPDSRAKVLYQTSHWGDGLRRQIPTPCPHSPHHGVYIDRCIRLRDEWKRMGRDLSFILQHNPYSRGHFCYLPQLSPVLLGANPRWRLEKNNCWRLVVQKTPALQAKLIFLWSITSRNAETCPRYRIFSRQSSHSIWDLM